MCKRIFKEQTDEEGEVPFYKIGTFGGEPDAFISRELFDEYKLNYPYPNKGDILISASGSIGRTVEFTGKDEYFQDSNIVWLKHGNKIDNSFLKVLYGVVEWSCEGSTIKRLYNDNFLKTEFMLPRIEEQIKLGEYFSNLDNLIALHQRKQCILYIMKKLLCGKNKQLEKSISWEQRKLENILSLENGFAFQSEYFVEEKTGYVVATPGNVSVEGGFICEGGKNYSVSAPFNERFIFKSGDIFVTMTDLTPTANTLGKPAIVPDNGIIYLHNQRLGKLVDYNCNKKFLFALLCTDKYHSQIVKTASGTTVRHSSPDKILSYETFVPKFEEQKMIGKFFSNLDHFIALHQRKP